MRHTLQCLSGCLAAWILGSYSPPAIPAVDSGIAVLRALSQCDGQLFQALARDAARWQREPSFRLYSGIASFRVADRSPPEGQGRSDDAIAAFRQAREIGGLHLLAFHDSDLSHWSVFARKHIRFRAWGFYAFEPSEDLVTWFRLNAPQRGQYLAPSSAPKNGVFCIEERLFGQTWHRVPCSADDGFPTDRSPRRWFVIRPDSDDETRSVLSCEYSGDIPSQMMREYRPDLPARTR